MFQNHLLQILTLLTMEAPVSGSDAAAIADAKVTLLKSIQPLQQENIVRGQYRGYRGEDGVAPNSMVETYVAARLAIRNWRWAGVPFFIRTGKSLTATVTEVHVRLKAPPVSLFGDAAIAPNTFAFRLSPDVSVSLNALAKQPDSHAGREVCLVEHHHGADDIRGTSGCWRRTAGNRTLFGDEAGVEASWRVVDIILGQQAPPCLYKPNSCGPAEADALAADVDG